MSRNTLSRGVFDIDDVSQEDMNKLANIIEEYIDEFEEIMIFPENFLEKHKRDMEVALKRSKQLVKKLRKGDRSVFKKSDRLELDDLI